MVWSIRRAAPTPGNAWSIGLGWTHGEHDIGFGSDTDKHDIVVLRARYGLTPGLKIDAIAEYSRYDSGILSIFDYEGLAIAADTLITS
jgi:hypothetical protein